jgi:ribosomal protein L2
LKNSALLPIVNHTQIRTKTFRKKTTKPQKRYFKYVEKLKAQGLPVPPTQSNVLENKFWKVSGNMKIYKPVSPGCRNRRHATRFHLHKGTCIRRLSYGKRSTGGRGKTGRITVRHKGGGHKRRVRAVDFLRSAPGPHEVVRLEYDPNRTAELALLRNLSTNEFSYIIRPAGLQPGDIVNSYRTGIPEPAEGEDPIPRNQLIQRGNCLRLKDIPVGTMIHCIGLRPDGPGQICRSAGTSGQLISTGESGQAQVRLSSKEVRMIPVDSVATIGVVGNEDHHHRNWGKAGAKRRRGIRPTVRGIAQNPCDHPTGGGSKSKGNKHPRSPWGWLTKGWKTVR